MAYLRSSRCVSILDCIKVILQSWPRFWQNEPSAGISSRSINGLAVSQGLGGCRRPADHRVADPALDAFDDLASRAPVPAPIQGPRRAASGFGWQRRSESDDGSLELVDS